MSGGILQVQFLGERGQVVRLGIHGIAIPRVDWTGHMRDAVLAIVPQE